MSDSALENAISIRDEMTTKIAEAKRQIDEWQQKIERAERFIAGWEEFSGKEAPPAARATVTEIQESEKPKATKRKNPPKEAVAEASREIAEEAGRPLSRNELYEALPSKGLVIEGKDPPVVLQTMLWRMQDRITHIKGHGYWPAEKPYAPAGYLSEDPGGPLFDEDADDAEPPDPLS